MQTKKEKLKVYVSENVDKFYRLAFSYAKNQEDAEDIVNESVARALTSIESLREDSYMGTWLYRIVINTSNTYLKKRSKIIFLDELINKPEESKEDQYKDFDLYQKVMKLTPKYRNPIILRFYEDMTTNQIADILGENVNTVKTRLYTALKKLKMNIDEEMKLDEGNL